MADEEKRSEEPKKGDAAITVADAQPVPTAVPAEARPAAPAGAPKAATPAVDRRRKMLIGIGAALVVVPGALLAYLLGRPMGDPTELGFATLVPGHTGYSLHPSTAMFYLGILSVLLVGAGAATLFSALFQAESETPGSGEQPGFKAWLKRHAWSITLLVIGVLVLFPTLGRAGLWDPWESHYGLVALRMVEQDDWISTCDMGWTEWFWSKPILLFWLIGLGMVGLGQDAAADANPPLAEWAFRLPIALLALAAVMAVYLLASRRWGRRAGFLAGIVLLTMPQFFLIARQAMTDMPFVATMTIALCFAALALGEPVDRPAARFSLFGGRVRFSSYHLVVIAITAVSLPQALLVLTHNQERALAVYRANASPAQLRALDNDRTIHDDVFIWGSLGQAEDGNDRCDGFDCSRSPNDPNRPQVNHRLRPHPEPGPERPGSDRQVRAIEHPFPALGWAHRFWGAVFLVLWAGAVLVTSRRGSPEVAGPTQRDVYLMAFYLMTGVATLAKGLLGFALPGLILFLYLVTSGEWRELKRFRIFRGAIVFLAAAGPWYTMMIVRHGTAWWNQFIVHDHFKRSASGVHGDRGALGYFVQQLGIGTFPWAALIPTAVVAALWLRWRKRGEAEAPEAGERTALLAALWGISMFTFFTVMSTKFHHYVFPALPGFALCVGLLLDRMIDDRSRMGSIVAIGALGFFAFVARDLTATVGSTVRGYERLIQLFMYKYDRAWPDPKRYGSFLDYSTEMMVFAAVFGVLLLLLIFRGRADAPGMLAGPKPPSPWLRVLAAPRLAVTGALALGAAVWAGWGLSVYFDQISPHWSEGYLVKRFYELRTGPEERLIAYSLNWHGENSYTANRAKILMTEHGFQQEWDDFVEWLKRHRGNTYFFIIGKNGIEGVRSKLNSAVPGAGQTVEMVGGDISNKYDLARGALCAPPEAQRFFGDEDGDGHAGGPAFWFCGQGRGRYTFTQSTDCDDGDAGVHPGAAEVCNDRDDDCNGMIDDGADCPEASVRPVPRDAGPEARRDRSRDAAIDNAMNIAP